MSKLENLVGVKFGKVTVIARIENFEGGAGDSRTQYVATCDCGRKLVKTARDFKRVGDRNACRWCRGFREVKFVNGFRYGRNANGFIDKSVKIPTLKKVNKLEK